jgi:hypothetical protein
MEDATIAAGRKIKAANPEANVGMYYRSDMALELADCSPSSAAWNAHPEWWLKDDKGNYVTKNGKAHQFDFSNPACAAFFTSVYRYVLDKTLPSGKPVINYMYMDGAGCSKTEYAPGIGAARSDAICTGKMNMIATLQAALNAEGAGQNLILNGMDTPTTADLFVPTGAAGAMFDHWTILQYVEEEEEEDEEEGAAVCSDHWMILWRGHACDDIMNPSCAITLSLHTYRHTIRENVTYSYT